jgi:hypothetical protein
MKRSVCLLFGLALFLALAGMVSAQSSDRDRPTVLTSGEISGSLNNHNGESFYSFTAGPGELTITVDVTVNHRRDETQIGVLNFELLGRDASTSILCCVRLTRRQTVILHTTNGPVGGGTFHVRLSGANSFSGSTTRGGYDTNNDTNNDNNRERSNRDGEQITVPETGILHIRMKNGTTQDIDLNRVRNISVRP